MLKLRKSIYMLLNNTVKSRVFLFPAFTRFIHEMWKTSRKTFLKKLQNLKNKCLIQFWNLSVIIWWETYEYQSSCIVTFESFTDIKSQFQLSRLVHKKSYSENLEKLPGNCTLRSLILVKPGDIYLLKVTLGNTRRICKICSKVNNNETRTMSMTLPMTVYLLLI